MRKTLKIVLITLGILFIAIFCFFFVGKAKPAEKITWGVAFSQKHAELLGLDWKENYLAILDDLGVKNLKLIAYWDLIEKQPGVYDFSDLDWQINEAKKRGVKILLVFGRRVPRWPECFIPKWALYPKDIHKEELLKFIKVLVERYKNNDAIWAWQVENEPFFPFGKCPPPDENLLKQEIKLVKSLDDKNRPVVITESGEIPLWFHAARLGDIVGHTLYKKVWVSQLKIYFTYPFPPIYYGRKAWLINKLFHKKVICVELQAEPWGPVLLYDLPLEEQKKTMNLNRFKKMIDFAKNTGEDTFYLWGAEWWYWMGVNHNRFEIWEEARKLFQH
ncbi:endo-1,4-beta-xylanase [bacterium]|nr:endo-1,4-beta-xylanase [bacterium]